ncbi:spore coat protein [Patescibacteria group bacterium]|nr:MAG: spore coat protein [Patescibacteria group bacterium]
MKGIILAGGSATRLYPSTLVTSKQLLPVYDRPMIFYPLNTLIRAGIRDILIIVAPEHSGDFMNLLGALFFNRGVKISFQVQQEPRGLPEAFILGENHIDDDNVALILGDNIFQDDFSSVVRDFRSGGQVFATQVNDPERFGVVKFDRQGKANRIVEKPDSFVSDYAVTGLYLYDSRVVDVAKRLKPSRRGELEIVDLHNWYLRRGELKVKTFKGAWLDAGTHDALLEAGNIVRQNKINENFDPIIVEALAEYCEAHKRRMKRRLG